MIFCIHKVASVKLGKRSDCQSEIDMIEQQLLQRSAECGSPVSTQAEFFVFSDIFAWVLVPTLCRHLSSIFMTDMSAFCEVFPQSIALARRPEKFSKGARGCKGTAGHSLLFVFRNSAS